MKPPTNSNEETASGVVLPRLVRQILLFRMPDIPRLNRRRTTGQLGLSMPIAYGLLQAVLRVSGILI